MQTAAVALLRAGDLWQPGKATFSTYAVRAMHFALIRVAKKHLIGRRRERPLREARHYGSLPDFNFVEVLDARAFWETASRFLPERLRLIVEWRYGLAEEAPQFLSRIGERLGLTRERTRALQMTALRKLGDLARGPLANLARDHVDFEQEQQKQEQEVSEKEGRDFWLTAPAQ